METDKLRELHGDKGITSPYEQWALTLDPNSKYYDEIYSMGVYNTIYTDDRYAKYRDENHMYNTEKPEDSYAVFNFPKLSQKEYNWDIQKYKKENYNLDWNKPGPGHSYGQITYTDPADGKVYIINPVDNPEHRENIYALVKDGTFDLDYDGKERKFLEDGGISIGDITLSEIKVTPSEPKIPWYKFKERHKKDHTHTECFYKPIEGMLLIFRSYLWHKVELKNNILKDRIIMLEGGIGEHTASVLCAQLLFLESTNSKKDITLYINSPGGLITAGMAIYDTMQYVRSDIQTIVVGQAASMGSLLASAGTKGKRFMLPHSRHMIHQPLGGTRGQATDIEIHAREILRWKEELTKIYEKNTGQKLDTLKADMERDKFMTAEEAVKYGLADKIVTSRDEDNKEE